VPPSLDSKRTPMLRWRAELASPSILGVAIDIALIAIAAIRSVIEALYRALAAGLTSDP